MNGITLNDFKAAAGGTPVSQPSVASAVNAVPEYKADKFATQAQAQEAPKKKRTFGIFGSIASTFMKIGATIKGGTNGVVNGVAQGTALGAVAYVVGGAFDAGAKMKDPTNPLKFGTILAAPFKSIWDGVKSTGKTIGRLFTPGQDIGIKEAIGSLVKAPFKFVRNFMTDTKIGKEFNPADFAKKYNLGEQASMGNIRKQVGKIAKDAKKEAKNIIKDGGEKLGFFAKKGQIKSTIAKKLSEDGINTKVVSKPVRIIALSVGTAVLLYNVIKARLNINNEKHDIDAKFTKVPTTGPLHHTPAA